VQSSSTGRAAELGDGGEMSPISQLLTATSRAGLSKNSPVEFSASVHIGHQMSRIRRRQRPDRHS